MMPRSCAVSSASAICRAIASDFLDLDSAAPDAGRQILALDELHHQRERAVHRFDTVDVRDAWMIECGKQFASRSNRAMRLGSAATDGGRIFSATSRFNRLLWARWARLSHTWQGARGNHCAAPTP